MRIHRILPLAAVLALPSVPACQAAPPEAVPAPAASSASVAPAAQRPARFANAEMDTTYLRPGADTATILFEHEGDTLEAGIVVMERRMDRANRRLVYVQRMLIQEQPVPMTADSVHLEWPTLFPTYAYDGGDTQHEYRFSASGVRITSPDDGTTREVALPGRVHLPSIVPLLLRALPLAEGYETVLPILAGEAEPRAGEMRIRVAGRRRVRTLDGGSCDSWVVVVDERSMTDTFSVSIATRNLVRQQGEYGVLARATGC